MKNICFFTSDMSWSGGTNKCTSMIANSLAKIKNKYKIFVLDLQNEACRIMYQLNDDVNYSSLNLKSKSKKNIITKLRKYLRANNIAAIINVEGLLGIYSVPASLFTNTKTIIWEHGNYFLKRYNKVDFVRWLEFKLCDHYVTLTNEDKEEFSKHFKGKCKLHYIYNACETLGKNKMCNVNSKNIITVGMNRYDKGYDMLVEIAHGVYKRHPEWHWNIYGDIGIEKNMDILVNKKIKQYHITKFLSMCGLKNNLENCYKESSIMVMTSRREGLPMALLEARGYGIPMIAFDIKTGPSEIIDNELNGYLIEPYNKNEMIEKICKLIENDKLRQKFSEKTQEGIEKFDIDYVISRWDELLEEI